MKRLCLQVFPWILDWAVIYRFDMHVILGEQMIRVMLEFVPYLSLFVSTWLTP